MSERRQPGVPERQVVAEGVDAPDHDLDRKVLVEPGLPEPERGRTEHAHQHDQHARIGQVLRRLPDSSSHDYTSRALTRPNSPRDLNVSTTISSR